MTRQYFHWVTTRSTAILACYTLLAVLAGLQLGNIRLDASSDSLLLQGDPDLICCRIGGFSAGACRVLLQRYGASDCLWEGSSGLTGFGCAG